MPLNFSAAHTSRITKRSQQKPPSLKRSVSSPFASFGQRKPIRRTLSKPEATGDDDDFFGDRLEDIGTVKSLLNDLTLRDVAQIVQYARSHMFDVLPENGGFNSTRIAEILNFRKSLPSTVTVTHVHALTGSPTRTEREIAGLIGAGIIRRVVIPGRGTGRSSVANALILFKDIETLAYEAMIDRDLAHKFVEYLRESSISRGLLSPSESALLVRAGFLTSASHSTNTAPIYGNAASASSGTNTSIAKISKAASGSIAAIGGQGAIYEAGGRGGIRRSSSQYESSPKQEPERLLSEPGDLQLSIPGTGPYLRLLTNARSHMVSLLMKSKFQEMPENLLRERWDGGISADDTAAKAKKYRGEFAGEFPSRTRKWKQFYGLSFDWILAECLGAGLIEVFETGSVGRGIRVTSCPYGRLPSM